MKKGQGSLEYLLILAAILAIAVVVVVIANSMLTGPQEATAINEDKYSCAMAGIEIIGYSEAYEGDLGKEPSTVVHKNNHMANAGTVDVGEVSGNVVCQIGEYNLKLDPGIAAYLETADPTQWIQYGVDGGAANQPPTRDVVDQFITTGDAGAFCDGGGAVIDPLADPVFDLKFNFTGVDRAAITSSTLQLWEAYSETTGGVVSVSKITQADFRTTDITGTNEQTLPVGAGGVPASLTLPFAITEDFLYLRMKKTTAAYTVYCGKDATDASHRPYIALAY